MANILTCSGFSAIQSSWIASAPCMKARLGLVFLFFFLALIRKWGAEEWGINFSLFLSAVFGVVSYFIVITIFASFKIALVIGLVTGLVGGYGAGMFGLGEGE